MSQVVAELPKSRTERLRISWEEYEGAKYLDLRVYYLDGTDVRPTKKGVTVSPARLQELIDALKAAAAMREVADG